MKAGLLSGLLCLVDLHSGAFKLSSDGFEERWFGGVSGRTKERSIFPVSIDTQLLGCEASSARDDPRHFPGNECLMARDDEIENVVVEWKPRSRGSFWSLVDVVKAALDFDHIDAERSKAISGNDEIR